jgi:TPP-dependent pyruvate/acetoin dehydrogenase alpha subunit
MNSSQQLTMYQEMLRIRLVEEQIANAYAQNEMRCPIHLSIGQEATAVGACAALDKTDYIMSNHRSHGHYLAKGGDLKRMIAELYGKATGCTNGKGGSMHLIDESCGFLGAAPIVGGTVPIATGVAFSIKMKMHREVVISFIGDAVVEEGVFHESLNFAELKKLPIIYVCENNLYSVNSPMEVRQPSTRQIRDLAKGHGVKVLWGDGNDVEQVWNLTRKAVAYARSGKGPIFLELATYRWLEHCGPNYDNHIGYRTEAEFKRWKKKCPIGQYEKFLQKNRVLSSSQIKVMKREIGNEINKSFAFAKKSPFPEESTFNKHVYAN